jgi:hypothetical protein
MITFIKAHLPTARQLWNQLESLAITLFIGGLWFITAIVSYWTFLDTTPAFVSFIHQEEQVVRRGDVAVFKSNVDWLRACEIKSERHLIGKESGQDTLIAEQTFQITKEMVGKTAKDYYIVVFIPNNMPTGDYWFERRTTIACNPMQKIFPMTFVSARASITIK